MKKVGTQVELDLTKVLKMLDKAFVALKKQSKVWDDWLNVVKKALPTLAGVESALGKVTGRLNQLKFTEEGATEAGKEEIAVRRRQITVLQAVRDEYKKQADEIKKTTHEQERHTKASGAGLKKMLLWGIGAASAYRLFMKMRRAIVETTKELYGNTEEWERLTAAASETRRTFVAMGVEIMGGIESLDWLSERLQRTTELFTQAAGGAAILKEYLAVIGEVLTGTAMSYEEAVTRIHEAGQQAYGNVQETVKEATGFTKDFIRTLDDMQKSMDAWRKRTEKYHKALHRITERGLADRLQAQRDYYDNVTELELDRQRKAEDDAIEAARRLEDIHRDFARRLAALEMKLRHRIAKLKRSFDRRRRRAAEILADKLLSIERKYQDKLLDIERTYARSMYEAIATRDATAALQAMRRRKEDIVDATRDRDRARADAFRDYRRRIHDLEESLREQERLARESYEDQLEELHRWLAEQEEDHRISLRRREEDAALSYARSLVDLKQSFLDRLAAIQRQSALERRNAKIDYLLRESTYAAHLARMAAIWQSYQGTMTMPSSSMPAMPPPVGFAEGGMMIVNRPTLAMFGEGGRPELVIAQPLSATSHAHSITGSVTHQINATISQSIAGMEGRIAGAVHQALVAVIH